MEYRTKAELSAHYAGVRSRLGVTRNVKPLSAAKPIVRERDFILVQLDPLDETPMMLRSRWKQIVTEVCEKHKIGRVEVMSRTRRYAVVNARHEAMWRMRAETTMSLPEIGKRLGGFDHTTVLHGVRKHAALLRGEVYRQPVYGKAAAL
jgi:chromosomal replication initiation ATPase DnaA